MYLNIFVKFQSFKVIIFISGQMIISLAWGSLLKLYKPFFKSLDVIDILY